ncbi:hypothetical protein [Oceanobacillus sp. 1P07AA]|uniref:hypothetical protein n=1 Tax=Oceanobacillus sp. 1P07AA TaxID=3132293 RepID=UPI0039A5D2DB
MKKKVFVLMFSTLLCFSAFGNPVFAEESVAVEKEGEVNPEWAPVTRIWHEFGPVAYQGRTVYIQTTKYRASFEGYVSARNVGGGLFMYEGYLYNSQGPIPIPSKVKEDK